MRWQASNHRMSLPPSVGLGVAAFAALVAAAEPLEPDLGVPVVFFPPEPPVYGARIAEQPAKTRHVFHGQGVNPPGGMADFAGDSLYPSLATRLFAGTLHRELEAKLEAYRRRRNELLNPLLDRLVILQEAAEDGRDDQSRPQGVD